MVTRNFCYLFFVLLGVGCSPQWGRNRFEPSEPHQSPHPNFKIQNLKKGHGPTVQTGDLIEVHYRAWIYDRYLDQNKGIKTADTYIDNHPLKIHIGTDDLIEGWQEGLKGLNLNSKRRLVIPSEMAFGMNGATPSVPGGSHLIFELEIVSVVSAVGSNGSTSIGADSTLSAKSAP